MRGTINCQNEADHLGKFFGHINVYTQSAMSALVEKGIYKK